MSWISGWDSIAAAGWWSGFYFWVSIICLIGLGVAEVASHRYGGRKDELVTIEQDGKDKRHDDDMARVQRDAGQAMERAAVLEKEAAQLRLDLEKARGPRNLSQGIVNKLGQDLKPFAPLKYEVTEPVMLEPGSFLTLQLLDAFTQAGWIFQSYNGPLPTKPVPFPLARVQLRKSTEEAWSNTLFFGINSGLIGIRFVYDMRNENASKAFFALLNDLAETVMVMPDVLPFFEEKDGRASRLPVSDVVRLEIGLKQ